MHIYRLWVQVMDGWIDAVIEAKNHKQAVATAANLYYSIPCCIYDY